MYIFTGNFDMIFKTFGHFKYTTKPVRQRNVFENTEKYFLKLCINMDIKSYKEIKRKLRIIFFLKMMPFLHQFGNVFYYQCIIMYNLLLKQIRTGTPRNAITRTVRNNEVIKHIMCTCRCAYLHLISIRYCLSFDHFIYFLHPMD